MRLSVARHAREGEGDREGADGRQPGRDERGERLDPGLREPHPERRRRRRRRARRRASRSSRSRRSSRRRGASPPIACGSARQRPSGSAMSPSSARAFQYPIGPRRRGDAAVVLVEPRQHLPGERPDADGPEERGEAVEQPPRLGREERTDERRTRGRRTSGSRSSSCGRARTTRRSRAAHHTASAASGTKATRPSGGERVANSTPASTSAAIPSQGSRESPGSRAKKSAAPTRTRARVSGVPSSRAARIPFDASIRV